MPTTDADRAFEVLGEAECRELLTTARSGRLAFTQRALPAIQPVSFRLHDGSIVIPAHADDELSSAARGAVVALETGDRDDDRRLEWSVSVVGPSRLVTDPAEIATYDSLGWGRPMSAPDRCYVTVVVGLLRGWRTVPAHPPTHHGPARPVRPA
ncbi:pyridoxamine 5'-phosphate oxidase family protein [Geodermatophilus sp. SYSU D01186]